jgi:hypothetical protein
MVAFNGLVGGITGGVGSAFSGAGIATQVAVGAGIGGGGSIAQQEVFTGHVDWGQVALSTGVGGAAGGAGAMLGKLAAARQVNAGAVEDLKPPVPTTPTRIYSARVLNRMAEEPGPMHNFPGTFDQEIFDNGSRTVNPNYFNKPAPLLTNDSVQYRLPGVINGRQGEYQIFTRPSVSGRNEVVMHRFFQPARTR